MNEKQLLTLAVEIYGVEQEEMTIEEFAEAIKAFQKLKRAEKKDDPSQIKLAIEHLVEELIDAEIMIEQMKIRFPFKAERKRVRALKLARLAKKLGVDYEDA